MQVTADRAISVAKLSIILHSKMVDVVSHLFALIYSVKNLQYVKFNDMEK